MNRNFQKTKNKDLHCFPTMDFKIGLWNHDHIPVKLTLIQQIFIELPAMFQALF